MEQQKTSGLPYDPNSFSSTTISVVITSRRQLAIGKSDCSSFHWIADSRRHGATADRGAPVLVEPLTDPLDATEPLNPIGHIGLLVEESLAFAALVDLRGQLSCSWGQ